MVATIAGFFTELLSCRRKVRPVNLGQCVAHVSARVIKLVKKLANYARIDGPHRSTAPSNEVC
jgi:hypothetical protein